ncbi:monovalent cation/H+ antiporter complex subunit F [Tateyamaria sp. syn59]|uniref:monovalent cation/H+ antiporter complex subunit F n=1 Tax=Tateyamaria sp. syn59 TaxID=2576942 RepID=UPI0011BF17D5|nr:monovalent cation/H+ antiporter complex subunit F [Tateyamaria sp. syn59]
MTLMDTALTLGFALVFIGVGLAMVRLAIGPTLPDRVVALDQMTISIVAFCGLAAIRSQDAAFLDVALVLALVGFLATVALARFAERVVVRREAEDEEEDTQ